MTMDGSTPRIQATITGYGAEPVIGNFLLDTGSGGAVSMSGPFASKYGIIETMPRTVTHTGGFGVGGTTASTIGRLQSVEIGGVVFNEPVISVSKDKGGMGADENVAGLIGGRLMSRCVTILDYAGQRLILEPYDNISDPFSWNNSGITLVTLGRSDFHHFEVSSLVADLAGEKAGLVVGDVLLEIGGRSASQWEAHELSNLFRGKEQNVDLVFSRDGKKKSTTMKLCKSI